MARNVSALMMARKATAFSWLFMLCIVLAGCSAKTPEEAASQAALSYYSRLLEGYPDGLLAAKAGSDSLPGDYRHQLKLSYQQYIKDLQRLHGGLQAVALSDNPARRDSFKLDGDKYQHVIYTFLLLSFRDSTKEEITVPMVEENGEWRMK